MPILGFPYIWADLAGQGTIVWARVFYGAPGLAPLLFSDIGVWAGLVFLDPLPRARAGQEPEYGGCPGLEPTEAN